MHSLTEGVKRRRPNIDLRVATGASAGSANALISLIESCAPQNDDPTRGLGYQTWVPVGLSELFDPDQVTATSVFTRRPLEQAMSRISDQLRAGLRADCDVVLGVSVTRRAAALRPLRRQHLEPKLQIPHLQEKFVLRIRGRGPGRMPVVQNYLLPEQREPQPYLPLSEAEDDASQLRNFEHVFTLLYASAAFPLAFAPVELEHCMTAPSGVAAPPACRKPDRALFVDGGFFDNAPLRLNFRIVELNLREDKSSEVRWRAPAEPATGSAPPVLFAFIDPSAASYPALDRADDGKLPEDEALGLTIGLARSFVAASRLRELQAVAEDPHDGARVDRDTHLTNSQLPTVSSQLGAFFGFFERDFREFDFYVGMYDGIATFRRALELRVGGERAAAALMATYPVLARPYRADMPEGLKPLACLISQLEDGYAGHGAACDGEALRNFRVLLQVSLDRLHSVCARTPLDALPPLASPACFAAARGAARTRVRGVSPIDDERRRRRSDEADFEYTLRLLASYQFEFRDLGLSPKEAEYARLAMHRKLREMTSTIAENQPTHASAALVATVGHLGANLLGYEPPRRLIYLSGGTAFELGGTFTPALFAADWLRINAGLQLSRWQQLASPQSAQLALSVFLGPELQLLPISGSALHWMLGGRFGYQAAWLDRGGGRACTPARADGDARTCSQFLTQGYLAVAILERLRMQFGVEIYPFRLDQPFISRVAFQLTFGVQVF